MKYSAFVLLQTWLCDASARPFINLHFCSSIALSKTSAPPLMETLGGGLQVQMRLIQAGLWPWQWVARRNPADGVQEKPQETNICNMGRGSICAERGFLMKYGLLTVQEGKGRAV